MFGACKHGIYVSQTGHLAIVNGTFTTRKRPGYADEPQGNARRRHSFSRFSVKNIRGNMGV